MTVSFICVDSKGKKEIFFGRVGGCQCTNYSFLVGRGKNEKRKTRTKSQKPKVQNETAEGRGSFAIGWKECTYRKYSLVQIIQ